MLACGRACADGYCRPTLEVPLSLVSLRALCLLLLAACSDKDSDDTGPGAGDGGATDGGATDGGATDGGATDGGATDGGATDGGTTDGGATDGGATDAEWGYTDEDGRVPPESWAEYWPDCGGESQSPLDLGKDLIDDGPVAVFELGWGSSVIEIENNGHTLEWTIDDGSTLVHEGATYELEQFHFHAGSEHLIGGVQYPLEAHFVHQQAETGARLVVGVIFSAGAESPFLSSIGWGSLPAAEDATYSATDVPFALLEAIPDDWWTYPNLLTYSGSLTTPPCTEGVQWVVIGSLHQASPEQLDAFHAIYDGNHRPEQDPGDRRILLQHVEGMD